MAVRKFARVTNRVESGAIQFGEDLPGLFLRGDDAKFLSLAIRGLLNKHIPREGNIEDSLCVMHLKEVQGLIDSEVVKSESKPA